MMRRIAITSVLLTAVGCATTSGSGESGGTAAKKPMTTEERMRIGNQSPFDVAVCHPKPVTLPQPVNQASLVGALLTVRPQVMECLVDPKSRAGADSTRVDVKSTVNDKGGTHAISGTNLSPEGTACIQKAVDTNVPLAALPSGATAVEAETTFVHEAANSPSVKFGLNPGSDYSGAVRLAQPGWCECYAGFATKAPPALKSSVDLKKGSATAADLSFDPVGTPEGDQLAACLKGKMTAVPASLKTDELKFPYRFVHFNSRAPEAPADMEPELRFFQLELVRGQRAAETAMALGGRTHAAEIYDAAVTEYQKTKKYELVAGLKTKCADLVTSSEAIVNAIDTQLKVDQASQALATELKAKNEAWGELEKRMQEVVTGTQQDLDNSKKRVESDKAICPKETPSAAPAPKKKK